MSTQQHSEISNIVGIYMFSKVIECLEQKIRKEIDCKRPSSTKQTKRVQKIRIKICK